MDQLKRILKAITDEVESNSDLPEDQLLEAEATIRALTAKLSQASVDIPRGAEFLYALADGNQSAFMNYARQFPDSAINAAARDPRRMQEIFAQLKSKISIPVDDYVRKQLKHGKDAAAIYMLLEGDKDFAGLMERYENSGQSYFTRIRELVDEMGGGKKQRKEPSGLMGKIEKTQRSASLDEAIRNAKRFT